MYALCMQEFAVKLERVSAQHPQLLYESKLYKLLQGGTGIPRIKYAFVTILRIKYAFVTILRIKYAYVTIPRIKYAFLTILRIKYA